MVTSVITDGKYSNPTLACVPILRANFFRDLARRICLDLQAFVANKGPACHIATLSRVGTRTARRGMLFDMRGLLTLSWPNG